MDKKRRNKMIASYLADWVLTIFLWVSLGRSEGQEGQGKLNPYRSLSTGHLLPSRQDRRLSKVVFHYR